MKFLIDAQLPRKIVGYLGDRGHDAVHVASMPDGFVTPDAEITTAADAEGRVVVSKDADFVNTHLVSGKPAKLLVVRVGNSSNAELFRLLDRFLDQIVDAFDHAYYVELHRTLLVIHSANRE